ncbi:patatin-like phospholipase domain-containing protein 2 isoform X2 [Osmerus eperlanus]|uniref:patatin-like phospholipase domain-containing protein 2 isoform X2 n=1 Tax=Osmerus eperlanus TaxID=29151 RepID=UPI002E15C271
MSPSARSSSLYADKKLSVSFSGSGFLSTYQLGVVRCFLNHAPTVLHVAPRIFGASAGSLVAAAVVCKVRPERVLDELLSFARQLRVLAFGPLNPSGNVLHWIERTMRKILPHDAHRLASGRLAVAMTRVPDGKNTLVSKYESREDVIQALLCSCFFPGYCGMVPPSYKGVHYVDGGFTSIQPLKGAPSSRILTVSPFAGEMDICPQGQESASWYCVVISGASFRVNVANGFRVIHALYPFHLETLEKAYSSGYRDTIRFLHDRNLVSYLSLVKTPSESCLALPPDGWTDLGAAWGEDTGGETEVEMEETNGEGEEEEGEVEQEKKNEQLEDWEDKLRIFMTDSKDCQRQGSLVVDLASLEQDLYLVMPAWLQMSMLCNILAYLSNNKLLWTYMSMRLLSYLLLPVTLPLCLFLRNVQNIPSRGGWWSDLGVWLTQTLNLTFWVWQDLRQFTFFAVNTIVSTIERNVEDWWVVEYEGPVVRPQGQWSSNLRLHLSSSSPTSRHTPSPPPDPLQYTVLFRLDVEPGEREVWMKSPKDISVKG